jgi:formiminoglutamase
MSFFEPCSPKLFFKSTKTGDPRLGEIVNKNTEGSVTYVIAGYPDDEGIQINGGRLGAHKAPDVIRKYFYKTTPTEKTPSYCLEDIGNLILQKPLADRHEIVKNEVLKNLQKQKVWIGLGGGHDYGYPDGAGFLQSCTQNKYKPLIINFDAHLDVRATDQGLSSGTPFYRLLTDSTLPAFDFVEVGAQRQCNSPHHVEWLKEKTPSIFFLDDLLIEGNWAQSLFAKLAPLLLQKRPTYLSIDIDGFTSAIAPGCSQSWAAGLDANSFLVFLNLIKKRVDVRCLGIYEVSPPLDTDDRTSKWAAQILHQFIHV